MIELEDLGRKIERVRSDVRAILLYGSFARGEADSLSDVDLLIIVDDPSKAEKLNLGIKALITSEDALRNAVMEKPSIFAMLKEAIVLHGTKPSIPSPKRREMIRELNEAFKVLEGLESLIHSGDDETLRAILYSAILRMREAYLLRCLAEGKESSKKGFMEELKQAGVDEKFYDYYRLVRNGSEVKLSKDEIMALVKAVRRYLSEVRKLL